MSASRIGTLSVSTPAWVTGGQTAEAGFDVAAVSHWRSPRDDRTPRRQIPHSMGDYGEIGHPEIISQANPGVLQRDVCSDMISRTAMAEFRGSAIQPQNPIREVTVRQSRIRQTPGETGSRLHRKNQAPKELPCLLGNCANPAGCAATPRTGLWYRNPGLRVPGV